MLTVMLKLCKWVITQLHYSCVTVVVSLSIRRILTSADYFVDNELHNGCFKTLYTCV